MTLAAKDMQIVRIPEPCQIALVRRLVVYVCLALSDDELAATMLLAGIPITNENLFAQPQPSGRAIEPIVDLRFW